MIIETVILKNKVTGLEILAHQSDEYDYRLSIGESCYSLVLEYNKIEYIICTSRDYQIMYRMAENLSEYLGYPLAINTVTRQHRFNYHIVRNTVCVDAYTKALKNRDSILEKYVLSESDNELCNSMDFELTTHNWNSSTDDKD